MGTVCRKGEISLTEQSNGAAKPESGTKHRAMLCQLVYLVPDRVRPIQGSLKNPTTGGDTCGGSTEDAKTCIVCSAAEQKESGEGHQDHHQLHRLDAQVETKQADNAVPASHSKCVQGGGKCQAMHEPEGSGNHRFTARKERADGVDRRDQDGDGDQDLNRPAG